MRILINTSSLIELNRFFYYNKDNLVFINFLKNKVLNNEIIILDLVKKEYEIIIKNTKEKDVLEILKLNTHTFNLNVNDILEENIIEKNKEYTKNLIQEIRRYSQRT